MKNCEKYSKDFDVRGKWSLPAVGGELQNRSQQESIGRATPLQIVLCLPAKQLLKCRADGYGPQLLVSKCISVDRVGGPSHCDSDSNGNAGLHPGFTPEPKARILKGEVEVLNDAIGVLKDANGVLKGAIGVLKDANGVLNGAIGVLKGEVVVLKGAIGVLKDANGVLKDEVVVLKGAIGVLKGEFTELCLSYNFHPGKVPGRGKRGLKPIS